MANLKFIAVSRGLRDIVDYVTNREKTVEQLISGVNCVARTAVPEFEAVKMRNRICDHPEAERLMQELALQLETVKGRKSYPATRSRRSIGCHRQRPRAISMLNSS